MSSHCRAALVLLLLTVLSAIVYAPFLKLPLIADDYLQVQLGRLYGPLSGWPALIVDPLYRCRATSLVLTYGTERWFGSSPLVYNLSSLLLHILNTWLLLALLASLRGIGWKLAAIAAGFFAVYQGHQEAVVWYAATPELLVFLFGLSAVGLWVRWLRCGRALPRACWYAGALCCFVLALFSKESAVAFVPLLALLAWREAGRARALIATAPFAVLAVIYSVSIFMQRAGHQHFHDGTFSLQAPVWITLPNSFARLFWIWGLVSLLVLRIWRQWDRWWPVVRMAIVWIAVTLLPYSFLTYMPRVPSRHTYLASAALGLIVGAALLAFRERLPQATRWPVFAAAAVIIGHQCVYLWTKKYAQFVARAEPTEQLIRYARASPGPVRVHCFRYGTSLAQIVIEIGANKPASALVQVKEPEHAFCSGEHGNRSADAAGRGVVHAGL